jgi:hypothetical protein
VVAQSPPFDAQTTNATASTSEPPRGPGPDAGKPPCS